MADDFPTAKQKMIWKLLFKKDIPPELLPGLTRADSIKAKLIPGATKPKEPTFEEQAYERVYGGVGVPTPADSMNLGLLPRAETLKDYDPSKELKQKLDILKLGALEGDPDAIEQYQKYLTTTKAKTDKTYVEGTIPFIGRMGEKVETLGERLKKLRGEKKKKTMTFGGKEVQLPEEFQPTPEPLDISPSTIESAKNLIKAYEDSVGMGERAKKLKFKDFYGPGSYMEQMGNIVNELKGIDPRLYEGRSIEDTITGRVFKSDGQRWLEQ